MLVLILKSQFYKDGKLRSYTTYTGYTNFLPLRMMFMRLFTKTSSVGGKTYKSESWIPYHCLAETIQRKLKVKNSMVFRAQVGHSFREFWHGRVWAESPLWTDSHVVGRDGCEYRHGDNVYYERKGKQHVGKLIAIATEESSGKHVVTVLDYVQVGPKKQGSVALVWDSRQQVPACDILRKVVVVTDATLLRTIRHSFQDALHCVGASITTNGIFEIVSFSQLQPFMYQLTPSDTIDNLRKARSSNPDLELYRLYLVLFYDDFSTFSKRFHSVGGGYIQFGMLYFVKIFLNVMIILFRQPIT